MTVFRIMLRILFLLGLFSRGDAQHTVISKYDLESAQKLTNREVSDMVRDHQGFLWISTEDGLTRFDGERFIQFKRTYPEGRRVLDSNIEKVICRSDGQLVIKYSYQPTRLEIFDPVFWTRQIIDLSRPGEIVDLVQEKEGGEVIVLIARPGESETCYLTSENQLESRYTAQHGASLAVAIHPTLQSDWIVYNDGQVVEYDKRGKRRRSLSVPPLNGLNYSRERFVELIHEMDHGDLVISFEAVPGLFILQPGSDRPELIGDGVPVEYFTNVWQDQQGNRLLYAGSSFKPVQKLYFWEEGIHRMKDVSSWLSSRNQVTVIYGEDFHDGFAVGYTNGFDIMHMVPNQFRRALVQELEAREWGTSVRGIWQDQYQNTYIAREVDHWFRISRAGDMDTVHVFQAENTYEVGFKCSRNLVYTGSHIVGSAHFADNTYGLLFYDPLMDVTDIVHVPAHIQHLFLRGDSIWMACGENGGKADLLVMDLASRAVVPFRDAQGRDPFKTDLLLTIEEVRPGLLWVGGREGLYQIDIANRKIDRYGHQSPYPYNFMNTWIMDLHRHSDGTIYVGYRSSGFEVIDFETESKQLFTSFEGLAHDDVASFVEDSTGTLWIGTFNGLSRFHPEEGRFLNFYEADGIPHNEFNRYAQILADDEIWMGTVNGIMAFNPYEFKPERRSPGIMLSELRYGNGEGRMVEYRGGFNEPIKLEIPAGNRSVELAFHLDNYLTNQQYKYLYKLDRGAGSEWQSIGADDVLALNYLPVGMYALIVKGQDRYGNDSSNQIVLDLHVHQFFYESALFYGLLAILFVGLAFFLIWLYFRHRLRISQVRQDISRDLHDEVGSLLTGLAMKTDLLAMKVGPGLEKETKKLGTMGRDAVRLMRDIVWSIDASKNSMQDIMDRVREFASEVLPEKGIAFNLVAVNCKPDMKLSPEIRKNVYLIIRESINNVVKHADAKHVSVKLAVEGDLCRVIIADDGTKASIPDKPSGIGLKNIRERARNISGDLEVMTENGFEVSLTFRPNK